MDGTTIFLITLLKPKRYTTFHRLVCFSAMRKRSQMDRALIMVWNIYGNNTNDMVKVISKL